MNKIIIVVLLLALGACAAPAAYNFSRGELTTQEFGVVKGSYNLMDEWVGVSIAGFVKSGGAMNTMA